MPACTSPTRPTGPLAAYRAATNVICLQSVADIGRLLVFCRKKQAASIRSELVDLVHKPAHTCRCPIPRRTI